MSRSLTLLAATALAAISLVMMIGLLATGGAAARAGASPPAATRSISGPIKAAVVITPEDPYCYAWDFSNYTGEDVDGLVVRLQGNHTVSAVYTDTLNPFFGLDTGYEGGTDSYRLVFTDGLAYDSDLVHVGLCTNLPYARLSTAPDALDWTQGISTVQPAPLMVGVELNWLSTDQLAVNLVNEQAVTVTLDNFVLLDAADVPLPLDDLTNDIVATLPLAGEAITEPMTLAPNAAYSLTFDSLPGHSYVVQAQLSDENDSFNSVSVLAQTGLPPYRTYLPIVSK